MRLFRVKCLADTVKKGAPGRKSKRDSHRMAQQRPPAGIPADGKPHSIGFYMQLAASVGEETKIRRSDGEMVRIDKIL